MIDRAALTAWVEASCSAQGLSVGISDAATVAKVEVLLRGRDAAWQPPDGGERSGRPSAGPTGNNAVHVDSAGTRQTGENRRTVEDGANYLHLAI